MSEPRARASRVETLVPGVLHWHVQDERIDFRSDAYAVSTDEGAVLIDPLPLEEAATAALGKVRAICLTGGFHQRAAWRLRRELGVEVWAPVGAQGLEERPDHEYEHDAVLPGGLHAVHAPGPTLPHYVFALESPSAVFCADLVMRVGDGPFVFVPDEHQDDPQRTRDAAVRVSELSFDLLCPAHGLPVTTGGREALRQALEDDRAAR